MPERQYKVASGYRYGFNGKENDNDVKGEGNQQDYGMRIYDQKNLDELVASKVTRDTSWNLIIFDDGLKIQMPTKGGHLIMKLL